MQEDALPVGTEEAALSAQAHIHMEGVLLLIVTYKGLCEFQFRGLEVRTFHQGNQFVTFFSILYLRVLCDIVEIDGIQSSSVCSWRRFPSRSRRI